MSNKIILEITISNEDIDECIDVKDIIINALDDLETDGKFDAVEIFATAKFREELVEREEDIIIA